MALTTVSPSAEVRLEPSDLVLTNGSNTWSRIAGSMPGPATSSKFRPIKAVLQRLCDVGPEHWLQRLLSTGLATVDDGEVVNHVRT